LSDPALDRAAVEGGGDREIAEHVAGKDKKTRPGGRSV
jgi:hypothetical protein